MDKNIKVEVVEFKNPVSRWEIDLTPEKQFHKIDAIYDENMNFISPEYTLVEESGKLVLDFGLEPLKGYLRYSWVETIPDNDNDNNNVVVNVNNNCNDSGCDSVHDHQIINITDTKVIEVENKGIHSRKIKVYQYIGTIDGVKSYQDYTASVDLFHKERISDGKKFIRIESNINITGFIELY